MKLLKQKIPILLALLAFIAFADLIISMPSRVSAEPSASVAAQKGKVGATVEAVDLDAGIAPLTGKRVMYVLTDAEGGASLEATGQGRKVPAVITYNYRGKRDDEGHLVSPLFILRPGFVGGPFSKDEVASDSARSPGCWDNFQPGDLRN